MLAISALDPNGSPLANLPVTLNTTAGTLSPPSGTTDVNGALQSTVTPASGNSSQVVVVSTTAGAQTAVVNIVFQNTPAMDARVRRSETDSGVARQRSDAAAGAIAISQPFIFGSSGTEPITNPFLTGNECTTNALMITTITAACQQYAQMQNLNFQPGNLVNQACNAISAIGNIQDVLSCVGTGVTVVSCFLSGTGVGLAICAGSLDFTLESLAPECAQFIASVLTRRFLGDSAAQALQQVFILQDPTNPQNIITEGCIALQALFPPMNGNPGGHVYVADSVANTITVYDALGNPISVNGGFPGLSTPDGMAYDAKNQHIYAANLGNNTVTVYDLSGNLVILGSNAFAGLIDPEDITLDPANGHLYINEPSQNLVLVFDESGNSVPLSSGAFANLNQPFGVGWDSLNGLIYVTNAGNNTMTVYDADGTQLFPAVGAFSGLNEPDDVSWDPSTGNLYVTATASAGFDVCVDNNIYVYTPDGVPVSAAGGFPGINGPDEIVSNGTAVGAMYYVANICGASITVYDQTGKLIPLQSGAFANLVQPAGVVVVP
jgi:DNA-binding beta-propeller fold protein YncE